MTVTGCDSNDGRIGLTSDDPTDLVTSDPVELPPAVLESYNSQFPEVTTYGFSRVTQYESDGTSKEYFSVAGTGEYPNTDINFFDSEALYDPEGNYISSYKYYSPPDINFQIEIAFQSAYAEPGAEYFAGGFYEHSDGRSEFLYTVIDEAGDTRKLLYNNSDARLLSNARLIDANQLPQGVSDTLDSESLQGNEFAYQEITKEDGTVLYKAIYNRESGSGSTTINATGRKVESVDFIASGAPYWPIVWPQR